METLRSESWRRARWLSAPCVLALLVVGCGSTKPCNPGTVLLTITLDAASSAADTIDVDVSVEGHTPQSTTLAHKPGMSTGSVELYFSDAAGYPTGKRLTGTVVALAGAVELGTATFETAMLSAGCAALSVSFTAGADGGADADVSGADDDAASTDASVADGALDGSGAADRFDAGDAPCTPETDAELCTALGKTCGSATGTDNCGATRTATCGPETRACSQGGALGTCAGGTQACTVGGQWAACSILPAAADTCVLKNDDNCNGTPNDGCPCVEGTTRTCGVCNDGSQTCTNGKAGTYGACTGSSQQTVYYRDMDGDGYGSNATVLACGAAPTGYVAVSGDCCDTDGTAHPGVAATSWFTKPNACGSYDYDCDGTTTQEFTVVGSGCVPGPVHLLECDHDGWTNAVQTCGVTSAWSVCSITVVMSGMSLGHVCESNPSTQVQGCR
jgi:hypothetical protein